MQPTDSQLLGAAAAIATGVTSVYALTRPSTETIALATLSASIWGAAAVYGLSQRARPLGAIRFGMPEIPDSQAEALLEAKPCVDNGAMSNICLLATSAANSAGVCVGAAVAELASILGRSAGAAGILGQLRPDGRFAVEFRGAVSPHAVDLLNCSLAHLSLNTEDDAPSLVSIGPGGGNSAAAVEFLGIYSIAGFPAVSFEWLRKFLVAVEATCHGVLEEVLVSPRNLFGSFQAEGHVVVGFGSQDALSHFHGQLIRWQEILRNHGWTLSPFRLADGATVG